MTTHRRQRRRVIARYGKRGEWVKVVVDTRLGLVRVQWKEKRSPRIGTESWADSRENRASAVEWAKGKFEQISVGVDAKPSELTLLEMWQAFADDQFPHLRKRTRELYTESFRRWMTFFGDHFIAERTSVPMAGAFRKALAGRGLKVNTIRQVIGNVKLVYRWAQRMELITQNRLSLYRFAVAKEDRPTSPAEYVRDEFDRLLAQLDPKAAEQWRAFVALSLCGYQGARQNAVLHINVLTDLIDLDGEKPRIVWRSRWDKVGREWAQPLRKPSIDAIRVALAWREQRAYAGPWLLPAANRRNAGETYSQKSLWSALKAAEKRAEITAIKGRGAHGLRRMLAGDVAQLTGNPMEAMRAIGDTDIRQAERYVKNRDETMTRTFATLDEQHAARADQNVGNPGNSQDRNRNEDETQPNDGAASGESSNTQVVVSTGDSQ